MDFQDQKVQLDIPGPRIKLTLSLCERVINSYEQLDRYIEILENYRKPMRDGKPSESNDSIINITL